MMVFLTARYMEKAADADYVVILDCGQISAVGTIIGAGYGFICGTHGCLYID